MPDRAHRNADWTAGGRAKAGWTLSFAGMALAVMAWVAPATPGLAQDHHFSLRNLSQETVASIQISPDYSTSWGSNKLVNSVSPGSEVRVPVPADTCFIDLQVVGVDGRVRQYWGVNFCSMRVLEHR